MEDIDCKSDCMYKDTAAAVAAHANDDEDNVIYGNKTDVVKDLKLATVTNGFESICLKSTHNNNSSNHHRHHHHQLHSIDGDDDFVAATASSSSSSSSQHGGDINHNGNSDVIIGRDDVDSDTECTEPSERTVKSLETNYERSVETSTETLVSENVLNG